MNWIKRNWLSLLAVVLSITALVRCEPFEFKDSALEWIITIFIAIIGSGIVVIMGYQFYNAISLDKRINDAFNKKSEEVKEEMKIAAIRTSAATLYQAEGVCLKVNLATKDYTGMISTLKRMADNAIGINEVDYMSDLARLIINTNSIINRDINQLARKSWQYDEVCNLLEVALIAQCRLSASNLHAHSLNLLISELKDRQAKYIRDGVKKEV